MTREEAIKVLSNRDMHGTPCGYTSGYIEALDIAIEALELWDTTCDFIESAKPMPQDDLISRQAAVNTIHKYFCDEIEKTPHEIDEDGDDVYTDMPTVNSLLECNKQLSKQIKALPSAEPKYMTEIDMGSWERGYEQGKLWAKAVHGEWIEDGYYDYPYYVCSNCGQECGAQNNGVEIEPLRTKYCPNCGAKMGGK